MVVITALFPLHSSWREVSLPLFLQMLAFDDSSQNHYAKHQASHFLLKTYSSSTSGNLNEWGHYPQFILSKLIVCLSLPGTILFAEDTKSPSWAINKTQMLPQRVMRSVKKTQQDKGQWVTGWRWRALFLERAVKETVSFWKRWHFIKIPKSSHQLQNKFWCSYLYVSMSVLIAFPLAIVSGPPFLS